MAGATRPLLVPLLFILLAAPQCKELDPIEPSTCGNGVIEAGEDCDTHPGEVAGDDLFCNAQCRYTCDADAQCPTGWGCGADLVCRVAQATFEEKVGSQFFLPNRTFRIEDMDGDQNTDLVGLAQDKAIVLYGDGLGAFEQRTEFALNATAPPRVAPINSTGGSDLLVPLEGRQLNVVLGVERELVPVSYPALELAEGDASAVIPITIDPPWTNFLRFSADSNGAFVGFPSTYNFAFNRRVIPATFAPITYLSASVPADTRAISVAATALGQNPDLPQGVSASATQVVLGVEGSNLIPVLEAWLHDSAIQLGTPPQRVWEGEVVVREEIQLPAGARVAGKVLLADVNNDKAQDLLIPVIWTGTEALLVALQADGGFGPPRQEPSLNLLAFPLASNSPKRPWPLAAGDINGDTFTDYVSSDAVFIGDPTGTSICGDASNPVFICPFTLRETPEPWTEAAIAHFHSDEFGDVVATSRFASGISLLTGTGTILFNRHRIETDGAPFGLAVGDFDGDLIQDLAFAEASPAGIANQNSVSVAFGQSSGPLSAPVWMGDFGVVAGLSSTLTLAGFEGLDLANDLFVESRLAEEDIWLTSISFLLGSGQRRLSSPLQLSPDEVVLQPDFSIVPPSTVGNVGAPTALAGRFDTSSDVHPDIVAIVEGRLWFLEGLGDAQFSTGRTCDWRIPEITGEEQGLGCMLWETIDLESNEIESLIGVDWVQEGCGRNTDASGPSRLIQMRDFRITEDCEMSPPQVDFSTVVSASGALVSPTRLKVRDVNVDGYDDVVLLFGGSRSKVSGALTQVNAGAAVFWNNAGALDTANPTVVRTPEVFLEDVDAANLDGDSELELVLLANTGIYFSDRGEGGNWSTPDLLLQVGRGIQALGVLDANQDGLDDSAVSDGTFVTILESVPRDALEP